MLLVLFDDNIRKPSTLFEREEKGENRAIRGVSFFKVHCTHVWNYHNETPLYY
jgi:hypothetical protein